MLLKLFLLFTIVPVIELYLLIKVGRVIGTLPTIALVLAISFTGAWLVRAQGFAILDRIRQELAEGRVPAASILDGALVLVGGVLLLTPGFFTDALGLLFLVPASRAIIKQFVGLWLQKKLASGQYVIKRF
ncbi:MAG: FxsA family protein [Desulfuromonadales bacterium]|nr:MAG: FxsA family protein [Desulfuromonadales bacterium]